MKSKRPQQRSRLQCVSWIVKIAQLLFCSVIVDFLDLNTTIIIIILLLFWAKIIWHFFTVNNSLPGFIEPFPDTGNLTLSANLPFPQKDKRKVNWCIFQLSINLVVNCCKNEANSLPSSELQHNYLLFLFIYFFFQICWNWEGTCNIWSDKKTKRQWYGTSYQ